MYTDYIINVLIHMSLTKKYFSDVGIHMYVFVSNTLI